MANFDPFTGPFGPFTPPDDDEAAADEFVRGLLFSFGIPLDPTEGSDETSEPTLTELSEALYEFSTAIENLAEAFEDYEAATKAIESAAGESDKAQTKVQALIAAIGQ